MSNVKFPKMHLASSVVNRILNLYDEIELNYPMPPEVVIPSEPPMIAEPGLEGASLDEQIAQTTAPVSAEMPADDDLVSGVLAGDDLIGGI